MIKGMKEEWVETLNIMEKGDISRKEMRLFRCVLGALGEIRVISQVNVTQ